MPISGAGSLRDALAIAASGDTIQFAAALAGSTIALQSTLTIGQDVVIDGQSNNITISGQGAVTDFAVTAGNVEIDNLTIADGHGTGAAGAGGSTAGSGGSAAGGLLVQGGNVTLTGDTFANDTATGGKGGYSASPRRMAGRAAMRRAPSWCRAVPSPSAGDSFSADTASGGNGGESFISVRWHGRKRGGRSPCRNRRDGERRVEPPQQHRVFGGRRRGWRGHQPGNSRSSRHRLSGVEQLHSHFGRHLVQQSDGHDLGRARRRHNGRRSARGQHWRDRDRCFGHDRRDSRPDRREPRLWQHAAHQGRERGNAQRQGPDGHDRRDPPPGALRLFRHRHDPGPHHRERPRGGRCGRTRGGRRRGPGRRPVRGGSQSNLRRKRDLLGRRKRDLVRRHLP